MEVVRGLPSLTVVENGGVSSIRGQNVFAQREYFRIIKDKPFEAVCQ
jgi:hypothetical protein